MTRLLVSVRSAQEAKEALRGGAHLIDAKEPKHGSLGQCSSLVISAIVKAVGGKTPVSAALGELGPDVKVPPHGIRFAKLGLGGWRHRPDWIERWIDALSRLHVGCSPVAVAYADASAKTVAAPDVGKILDAAKLANVKILLIDTFQKDGGNLLDWLTVRDLSEIAGECRSRKLGLVLAGSLSTSEISHLRCIAPDWFAVRGAACEGGRTGCVNADRVRELVRLLPQEPIRLAAKGKGS